MTIESKLPTVSSQTTDTHAEGRSPVGKTSGDQNGQSFAGLLGLQSAQDGAEVSAAATDLTPEAVADEEEKIPLAPEGKAQHDINIIANLVLTRMDQPTKEQSQLPPDSALAATTLAAGLPTGAISALRTSPAQSNVPMLGVPIFDPLLSPLQLAQSVMTLTADDAAQNDINIIANFVLAEMNQSTKEQGQLPPDSALAATTLAAGLPTGAISAPPSSTALPQAAIDVAASDAVSQAFEIKTDVAATKKAPLGTAHENKLPQIGASLLQAQADGAVPPPSRAVAATSNLADLVKLASDIDKSKSRATPSLRNDTVGAPNLYDKWGVSPTYAVAQTSAAVPTTQLAETVSYWVTHGVQKADLTLDGLGSEPVEVHISVDGDQTRVDFRTSQIDVRQALESAAGQLKSLLASQGLQLLAVSVGTSARDNNPGGDRRSDLVPQKRHGAVVGVDSPGAVAGRVLSSPVGQALDLYV